MEETEKESENEPEIEKKAEMDKKLETPVEDNSASDTETGDKKNGLEEKEDNGKNESTWDPSQMGGLEIQTEEFLQ